MRNWSTAEFTSGRITVGSLLGVAPADPQPAFAYPHASEDLRLAANPVGLGVLNSTDVVEALRPTADDSVSAIFGGNLLDRKYVEESVQCRSLGAVMVAASRIRPYTTSYERPKLRLTFTDAAGVSYDVGVTDMDANQILAHDGPVAAVAHVEDGLAQCKDKEIMLRLGLARAFAGFTQNWHPMRAYLQCNGLLYR